MEIINGMKVYDKEDGVYATITKCSNLDYWYEDRVDMTFRISRECDDWNHIKVLIGGMEAEVVHGDYAVFKTPKYSVGQKFVFDNVHSEIQLILSELQFGKHQGYLVKTSRTFDDGETIVHHRVLFESYLDTLNLVEEKED